MTDLTKQTGLYLIVGAWNTLFGMGTYWASVWLLDDGSRFCYMVAAVLANIVSVSESFLAYKLLVFRTKGQWLSEYVKCWAVYGGVAIVNLAGLPFCVEFVRCLSPEGWKHIAPYAGGLVMTCLTVAASFIGHKKITFKEQSRKVRWHRDAKNI
jgi:putative flippase GtrA